MTPEQRIAELERKLADIERVMEPRTSYVEFKVPAVFRKEIEINGARIMTGFGSPDGTVLAAEGSLFLRRDGGATSTTYGNWNGVTSWAALT